MRTYCIARELYLMHCGGPNEKEVQKAGIYAYTWLIDFAIQHVK